jgi:hypothetical protein
VWLVMDSKSFPNEEFENILAWLTSCRWYTELRNVRDANGTLLIMFKDQEPRFWS